MLFIILIMLYTEQDPILKRRKRHVITPETPP